jgi:hypothetical protein
MRTLLLASSLPRRTSLALLAALLVALVMGMVATPSPAAAATTPAVKGGATGLTAVLDMHTVARIRAANGALQACVAGDKARATNQWTNAYGQTLYVEMYVGVNTDCQVRFREHLRASGSNGCNFDSDRAAIYGSNILPPGITKASSVLMGVRNFEARLNDGDCNWWYTGSWHTPTKRYIMSSDGAFHVHFLSPDHQGVDHYGCSQAWDTAYHVSYANPCFTWSPGDS